MTKRHTPRLLFPKRRITLPLVLAAAFHITPALSQTVAPNAAPTGGAVVGGAATIAKTPTATLIDQSSNRAIINWQSFSVGQNQSVNFQQPSSQSLTLNRVTGPDMSVIAGHITANGGIALVNQSGVFFTHGAQVQAQSVIVSTADISNRNFMAGGAMAFDQPGKPDARIVNDGSITIKQAGLAALVAPQVVNHGVIQARLGTVVLAGAETHVIDLNGDGLVSFDVTGAVRQAPNNGEALVTNTGVIRANGGSVQLTAAAADGIVQDLVRAGGKIQANTDAATGTTGRILLQGTGGSISVAGDISAQGQAAGTTGGSIGVVADRVQIESTGRVNASGRAGGGTIAIGASLPGAATQRLAQGTGIAQGAVIKADATGKGNGGHVVVNASRQALVAGSISVRGGPAGGNGGTVEVSSQGGLVLSATIDAGAPAGAMGSVLLDPATLTVVGDNDYRANVTNGELTGGILAFNTDPGADDYITTSQIGNITGALTLQATTTIDVEVAVNKPAGDLTLTSNGGLTINAAITLGAGNLQLGGNVVTINAAVTVPTANTVTLTATGSGTTSITEGESGVISAGTLTQTGAGFTTIDLGGNNTIQTIQTLTGGSISVHDTVDLEIAGTVSGTSDVSIGTDGALLLSGSVAGTNVTLTAGVDLGESGAGNVTASQLTLNAPNGAIAMGGTNTVAQLNASTAGTDLAFNDDAPSLSVPLGTTIQPGASLTLVNTGDLTINGTVSGTTTTLRSSEGTLTVNGHSAIARSGTLVLSAPTIVTNGLISSAGSIVIAGNSATLGGQALGISLDVAAPVITFNDLDASTMLVLLFPGASGTASGTLLAKGLEIAAGSGATLFGSIAGVSTGAAAALGVRATSGGQNLGNQPPNAGSFTFNGCPIAVAGCLPVAAVLPPVTTSRSTPGTIAAQPSGVASSPGIILVQNDPRRFDTSLTNVWLGLPSPPPAGLFVLPSRDAGEDLELAPPNVRAEDF